MSKLPDGRAEWRIPTTRAATPDPNAAATGSGAVPLQAHGDGQRRLCARATDGDHPRSDARVLLPGGRLEIRPVDAGKASGNDASQADVAAVHIASPADLFSETLTVPTFGPLPMQIVSAGRVVRLKVRSQLADARAPRLMIDRLPDQASFDLNTDGSRTLYWPTGKSDQGEHHFRITSLDPDDGSLASSADVVIVVEGSLDGAPGPGLLSEPASVLSERGTSAGPDVAVAKAVYAGIVEPYVTEFEHLPMADAHDPYSTYDDHPDYDPDTDFDMTYESLDTYASSPDDYFADSM